MSDPGERGERMSGDGAPNPQPTQQAGGQVNQEYLQMLCAMGIDQALAAQVSLLSLLCM